MNWKLAYNHWNNFSDLDTDLRAELATLTDEQKEDAFYTTLDFGTAGMRGVMGVGTNRMNIYTIRKANDGFARYIAEQGEEAKQRGVVIAYDSRHMSKAFADESARTIAGHGVKVYLFSSLRPTPELSFAVRHLHAFGGIVLTASHNPKQYNGYKIYDETGCQCLPEVGAIVVQKVNEVEDELLLNPPALADVLASDLVEIIDAIVDGPYNEAVVATSFADVPKNDIVAVYTALHGTGYLPVKTAFDSLGYTGIHYVTEQCTPDGDFTTVPFPNPEDQAVFDMAAALGKETGADILLATDPDVDRLGIAVRKFDGTYELLNGNVTGALMTYYILDRLQAAGKLPENGMMFTTVVSSDFAEKIADSFDVKTERTLTGFKFIGDRIQYYESTGEAKFLYGFEESYGSLVNSDIARDKDAVQAVVILTEMAAFYKAKGQTLLDVLEELSETYGYFAEGLENIALAGKTGAEQIKHLIASISSVPFTELAGEKVVAFENYITSERIVDSKVSAITLPKSDVLKFYLESGAWFCVRPSGTEPKAKVYIAVKEASKEAAVHKVATLSEAIMEQVNKILA